MFTKTHAILAGLCLVAAAILVPCAFHPRKTVFASSAAAPVYDKDGKMLPPTNYREWIFLTSGIGMNYIPMTSEVQGHAMFDNVFVNPEAYRSFLESGTWPDKTVIVLEARGANSKGSINESGHYQSGGVMDFEVHVKDEG